MKIRLVRNSLKYRTKNGVSCFYKCFNKSINAHDDIVKLMQEASYEPIESLSLELVTDMIQNSIYDYMELVKEYMDAHNRNIDDFHIVNVFISQAMSGIDEYGYNKERLNAMLYVTEYFKLNNSYDKPLLINFIDNYHHEDAPENADRLWHLGRSIQQLQDAEYIYFHKSDEDNESNGVKVERLITELYNIKVIPNDMHDDISERRMIYLY